MQTTKQIKIGDQSYNVKYPNVGEKLSVEDIKLILTDNNYGNLARSGHITALKMLDLVDAVAYFSILIPEIKTSLAVKDFLEMEPKKAKLYTDAYNKQFRPWMDEIDKELEKEDDDVVTTTEA